MAFNAKVKFPNKLEKEDVEFTVRQNKIHFVDVITTLYSRFSNPNYPIGYLYVTINGVLWEPQIYIHIDGKYISETMTDPENMYNLYKAPHFMIPYIGGISSIKDLSVEEDKLINLEVNYCTLINLLESDQIKYRVLLPPTIARQIMVGRDDNKFVWEYNLDLIPGEIDPNRITEWATSLFIDCIVYNEDWDVIPINLDTINVNNIKESTKGISNLLVFGSPSIEDYADTPLQHPLVEYFMFKFWGSLAVDRLNRIMKEMHISSVSLNDFFLIYTQLCDRAEASSVRPPCWPYHNPLTVRETYFISNSYAATKSDTVHNFHNTYPIVDEVTYLNKGCNPYHLCNDQCELKRRLLHCFPMADNLCHSGVLLAGTLPASLQVEELYKSNKHFNCVDLFIYGQTATKRYKSLEELLKRLEMYSRDYKIKYNVCKNIVTASLWKIDHSPEGLIYKRNPCSPPQKEKETKHCYLEIKIIYTNAKIRSEILYNFDSTFIQVGYDNCTFCSTSEFHYFTPRRESLVFRSSIQFHRLMKIMERGFLPVLDQDHCNILGSRQDLPKLICNRYTLFNFTRGTFITGLNHTTEQVKVSQKIQDRKAMGNTIYVENIHFIEKPTNLGPEVHLFHVLRKVSYEDVLLNSYNSYHGSKIRKLTVKRSSIYHRMNDDTIPLINMKSKGSLLVRNFEMVKSKKDKDKEQKRIIAKNLMNRSLEIIKIYQEALEQGKLIQEGSIEEGYYYRKPISNEETNRSTYVVKINNIDTYPTKEEIDMIIERESTLLDVKIGIAYFDVRVRIGEKCRAGVKLDGTRVIPLEGKRVRLTSVENLESKIMNYISQKDEMASFLKYGASLDIPVKAFYIKTSLEDKYIDTDEKTIYGQTSLDMDYNHTAVLKYDELMCFKLIRVTRNNKKTSNNLEEQEEEEAADSDLCSSDDSEDENCEEKRVILPTEVKRVINKTNCLDPVKCVSLNKSTTVNKDKSTTVNKDKSTTVNKDKSSTLSKESSKTVLIDRNIPIKSIKPDLFPSSEELLPKRVNLSPVENDNSLNEEDEEEELSGEDLIST